MGNPHHDERGRFSSGDQLTMTQAHQFATRGNIRVKPGAVPVKRTFTTAAKERAAMNEATDRRGWPGGQSMGTSRDERLAIAVNKLTRNQ
jgi:hypothetical protein